MVPLICYLGGFPAWPDGRPWVKMSSALAAPYEAGPVRIGHADPNPAGPGMNLLPVQAGVAGRHLPRVQPVHCGIRWQGRGRIGTGDPLALLLRIQSWLLHDMPQTVLALDRGQCLALLASGRVLAWWDSSEGIEGEILGAFGLSGSSAAGFDPGRADPIPGAPPNALIPARSKQHRFHFVTVPEKLPASCRRHRRKAGSADARPAHPFRNLGWRIRVVHQPYHLPRQSLAQRLRKPDLLRPGECCAPFHHLNHRI
ncbi:MAG: hypothetical protein QJR07_03195 [Acetobacteraceae bacterium]|nr:hypothetical protein [Acetobacteraceae bacterium]